MRSLPGRELIVVIPSIGLKTFLDVSKILSQYRNKFKRVLDKSLRRSYPGNCKSVIADAVRAHHTLVQEDSSFMEFACCVTNYLERENFEHEVMDVRVLDMS